MIDSPSVYVFGEILDHPNILALESDEGKASNPQGPTHVELLRIFAYGTYSDYQTHADKLPGTGIVYQKAVYDMFILNVIENGKFEVILLTSKLFLLIFTFWFKKTFFYVKGWQRSGSSHFNEILSL